MACEWLTTLLFFGALAAVFVVFTRPRLVLGISRRVVITGAASGLGRNTLDYLAQRGDFVVALDLNEKGLEEIRKQYGDGRVLAIRCDVTDSQSLADAVKAVRANAGEKCVDAIVNFAGVNREGALVEIEDKEFEMQMNVNVVGTFKTNKAFFPLLKRDNPIFPARIINTASEVGYARTIYPFFSVYPLTKVAVEGYSVALRNELAHLETPVDVVVLNPGAFDTPMTNVSFEHLEEKSELFKDVFAVVSPPAEKYIKDKKKSPVLIAKAVFNAVHYDRPPKRMLVNVSLQMRLARYTPQIVLDFVFQTVLGFAVRKHRRARTGD